MGTELHDLQPPAGAHKKKKRVGRGLGSGNGKTAGRGSKGQLARRTSMGAAFEGGQLPIHRRVPKRGFINNFRIAAHAVNVDFLENHFEAGAEVTPEVLHERGLVPKKANVIKILGGGELTKKLSVKVHRISESAKGKIEAAGGSVEIIESKKSKSEADEG